ncbi:hypothetical protein BJX63DRAFT_397631 [Aspergillus granulosus]|uniref:Chromo domain-containing protein n=1 Tax=Aspergillus granulosus TaxID=176169 RepID=A0ABR4H9I3_9EURO
MGSVSDDEISLTSTVESDQQSEYEVKTILSEHQFPDGMRYLVEWAGYPIERCTWEPANAFDFDETLLDWKNKKRLIADGKLPAFDVAAWEAKILRLDEEREERRRRRAAKRRKIALSGSGRGNQAVPNSQRPSAHEPSSALIPPLDSSPNSATRQVNASRHGPAARKLPPVLFATTQKAPTTSRPKKAPPVETHKNYTLSWKHKFEKRAQRDRAPDISQLDLRRPSDWGSVTSANAKLSNPRPGPIPVGAANVSSVDTDRPDSLPNSSVLTQHIQESPASSPRSNETCRENSRFEVNDSVHPSRRTSILPGDSRIMDSDCLPEIPPRKPGPHAKIIQRNRFWNPGELYVSMFFGPDKQDIGNARLCGIDPGHTVRIFQTKADNKIEIWFRYLCTLDEYEYLCRRQPRNIKYSNGWVEGFDDTEPRIRTVADILQQNSLLAIAQINNREDDALLAYLPRSAVFGFLDDTPSRPGRGYLRLALRSYLGPLDRLNRHLTINHQQLTNPGIRSQTGSLESIKTNRPITAKQSDKRSAAQENPRQLSPNPLTFDVQHSTVSRPSPVSKKTVAHRLTQPTSPITEDSDQLMVESMDLSITSAQAPAFGHDEAPPHAGTSWDDEFLKRFEITFDDLATLGAAVKGQKADMFYVWFPDNSEMVGRERNAIESFLKLHTGLLYSNSVKGDWEKFVATSKKANMPGAILFHESFIDYHKVPSLRDLLRRSVTGCWNISLSQPLQYVGHSVHKQRLFPHGGVFLITEDFMVNRLEGTLIILAWFHEWLQKKFPGNWKLMVRPGIQKWVLKQAEISNGPQQPLWLAMYHLLDQLGVSASDDPNFENDYINTFVVSPPTLPMYGLRTAEDSPDVPHDASQEYRDTDHLAEFFTGWTLMYAHRFRRFIMLTTLEPLPRWTEWQHIEIRRGSGDFFTAFSIDPNAIWSKLTKGASKSALHGESLPAYTPRTPRQPSAATSKPQLASSASHSQTPLKHKYAQPYQ